MKNFFLSILTLLIGVSATAQRTVGLINYQTGNQDGYVLFSPMNSTETYLINKCGEKVHTWNTSTYRPALSCFLMEDGSLLRTGRLGNPNFTAGGNGGLLEKFDWNGNLTWSYTISDSNSVQHHDMKVLPNGNILVIAWDRYTNAQALAMGKDTAYGNAYLWSDKILELQPVGTNSANIVWEWKAWDHLVQDFDPTKPNHGVVSSHPELINLNFFPGGPNSVDWIHFNSIDYNAATDQILVSAHTLSEVWIIDHSTTTAQAATHTGGNSGKGGDLLYRWGNPQAYERGTPNTKVLYGQHHATWIPQGFPNAGKILVFNNGNGRPGTYSSIDMIETPIDASNQYPIGATAAFLPTSLLWTYTAPVPADFYSSNISGVYPLSNGAFMIAEGASGNFFEIDANSQTVWQYINPVAQSGILAQGATPTGNLVFRCEFYAPSYPAFVGRTLTSLGEIELNPTIPSICASFTNVEGLDEAAPAAIYPNPFIDQLTIDPSLRHHAIEVYNQVGQLVLSAYNPSSLDCSTFPSGAYLLRAFDENGAPKTFKILKR